MDRLFKPSRVSEVLNKYGFRFSKALGQNFLIDGNIVKKIVDVSGIDENSNVLEIGPGIGTLTEELALRAKKVVAVELDKRLIDILDYTLPYENIEIINADFLKLALEEIREKFNGEEFKVVANLPYYITTPIIERLIESNLNINSITIMIQKEVAKRFTANPGTKDYGSLTVFIKYFSDASLEFIVPSTVFMPRPNVDSAVVKLDIKKSEDDFDKDGFFKLVRAAFSKRRKTLLNSLSSSNLFENKDMVQKLLDLSNVDAKRRAETLSLEEFKTIYINYESIGGRNVL